MSSFPGLDSEHGKRPADHNIARSADADPRRLANPTLTDLRFAADWSATVGKVM